MITNRLGALSTSLLVNPSKANPVLELPSLHRWWDSSQNTFQSSGGSFSDHNQPVGAWSDIKAGHTMIQASTPAKPTKIDNQVNGKPGIYFITDDWLDFNNPASPLIPATADWALIMVHTCEVNANTPFSQMTINATGFTRIFTRIVSSNYALNLQADGTYSASGAGLGGAILSPAFKIITFHRAGNTFFGRLNGLNRASVTEPRTIQQTGNLLGNRSAGTAGSSYNTNLFTEYFQGYFRHLIVLRNQTLTEIQTVESWLANDTGIKLVG